MKNRSSLILMEQLVVILVFALAAALCLLAFAHSHRISAETECLDTQDYPAALRACVRQIDNAIVSGGKDGMISMDQAILALYRRGEITRETTLAYADHPDQLARAMGA